LNREGAKDAKVFFTFPDRNGRSEKVTCPAGSYYRCHYVEFLTFKLIYYLDRIHRIIWIIFLYLKFPEEILNEQSATPKRETFATKPERALMVSPFLFI